MSKTIIVSNRLPYKFSITGNKLRYSKSAGGLATGMLSIHEQGNSIWIGWTGLAEDEIPCDDKKDTLIEQTLEKNCIPISLSRKEIDDYYYGFSNKTLWPLFHYFLCYTKYNTTTWEAYKAVNRKFADEVLAQASPGDTVWIHDYQLMLVPQYIRAEQPDLSIGFFLHIPFPTYEVFRSLPFRDALLEGMLGADIVGFHTFDYKKCFLKTVTSLLTYPTHGDEICSGNHTVKVASFPMGIDTEKFEKAAKEQRKKTKKTSEIQTALHTYRKRNPDVKLVLSIDRLDYTKGILNRIQAFSYFLKKHPQYLGKISLLMLAVPSRTDVLQYQLLKKEVDELVGRVNGKYATISWTPIWYYYRSLPFQDLIALYSTCEIALLTPLRDGMNLVAKEYISSRTDKTGVLILSEMTGAAKEMDQALIINPNSFDEISTALSDAIEMPKDEQIARNTILQNHLKKHNIYTWAAQFMDRLNERKQQQTVRKPQKLTSTILDKLCQKYTEARSRSFFLDYDGSLVGFTDDPDEACPDPSLLQLLSRLGSPTENELIIISGRTKQDLQAWFDGLRISLIAEHGLSIKKDRVNWEDKTLYNNSWMPEVKAILKRFTQKTKGAFIEEKRKSLAWHYRQTSSYIGIKHASELMEELKAIGERYEITILWGNKVIEIVNNQINKGNAVCAHLETHPCDFIFAMGDDVTDESMFKKLPDSAITIKVGRSASAARYYVEDYHEARKLLQTFVSNRTRISQLNGHSHSQQPAPIKNS